MKIIGVKVKHARPIKLSDPHFDFEPKRLRELLETPDEQLQWHHLCDLIGLLPAGTYSESIYFLPRAFNYLQTNDKNILDVAPAVAWFISEFTDELEADGLLDQCQEELMKCLLRWVNTFSIIHFDKDGCQAKGWKLSYFDYVQNSETVCETLDALDRYNRQADLADNFIKQLAALTASPAMSAWFLELAASQGQPYSTPARPLFQKFFTDQNLLKSKQKIAIEHIVPITKSPTYWNDTFKKLALS